MLNRLDVVNLKPTLIIDAGCGTGEFSSALQKRYPDARVIAIDQSNPMLEYVVTHHPHIETLCADIADLPLASASVDLIFANLVLPWQLDFKKTLQTFRRLLKPDGLLIFTLFGPDTLQEYRDQVLDLPVLVDMHNVGDLLLQEKFSDPVLDVEYYTLEYKDQQKLVQELQATGMIGAATTITPLPNANNKFETTYEIIFAHTFAPSATETFSASSNGDVSIPLTELKKKLKGS